MSNEKGQWRYAGIDVSARELAVAERGAEGARVWRVANTPEGHQQLGERLTAQGGGVRVCLEASGNYSLDVALRLSRRPGVEVNLVNPRQARRFAESLGERSKTDPVDARVLGEYAARMPWTRWQAPSAAALQLRAITRAIAALVVTVGQQKNRQHALTASAALPPLVARECARVEKYVQQRIERLRQQALRIVERDQPLRRCWAHLLTIPGVAQASGLAILGELAVLPATLDARQWVAHSGLDPKQHVSGSSVERRPRISRAGNGRLRAALFMPALVAVQHDRHLRAFYQRLVGQGKAKLQALTAVMRKLLHGIFAMFRHDQDYQGEKLCTIFTSQKREGSPHLSQREKACE
jgi:transposase